jgi:Domain of unknown function (DUF4281)
MESADTVFRIANLLVLAGWLALAISPLWRSAAIPFARFAAAMVCGIYLALLVRGLAFGPGLPEGAGFGTLAGVIALLSRPEAILAAWVHFLAFDLFVGSWQAADAPEAGVPHWLLLPCLLLTLLAGPVGLLLYLLIKAAWRRKAVERVKGIEP